MNRLPILGITMGDPCGIGPEITAKCLHMPEIYEICRPVVVGSAKVMQQGIGVAKLPLSVRPIQHVSEAAFTYGTIDVIDQDIVDPNAIQYGTVTAMGGEAAYQAVVKVIELAMANEVDATITGPLSKEALALAGHHYSGHTEIYADKTNAKNYAMMLASNDLKVIHVSTHVSLRQACDNCKKERVYQVIRLAHNVCTDLGITAPHIAVAGLNPHAGENGLFGTEEITEIIPAIHQAQAEGLHVTGPLPPDTAFSKARGGMYDIVVVQYHDQGHIPIKVVGFTMDAQTNVWNSVSGINITLGLPIIRVSVDHGVAFGKAGKGYANEESLINAIQYGAQLAKKRVQAI